MVTQTKRTSTAEKRFPGGGGSRRDTAARDRVVVATRQLLAEVGFGRLSIEAVAARAGVGKPTIYRWWPNKAHLAYEASCSTAREDLPIDTGDFATDVRRFVERVTDFFSRDDVRAALRGMLADADVSHRLHDDHMDPGREHFRAIVERGQLAGKVDPEIDPDALFEMAVGATLLCSLASDQGPRPRGAATERLVDALLRAALQPR